MKKEYGGLVWPANGLCGGSLMRKKTRRTGRTKHFNSIYRETGPQ